VSRDSRVRITVGVVGDDNCIRLTVRDDGEASPTGRSASGYGLAGMTERATLPELWVNSSTGRLPRTVAGSLVWPGEAI
jgi:glucose-6-phosphate-specific signal transduction histidine kinase